jgi:hypothetical protein
MILAQVAAVLTLIHGDASTPVRNPSASESVRVEVSLHQGSPAALGRSVAMAAVLAEPPLALVREKAWLVPGSDSKVGGGGVSGA